MSYQWEAEVHVWPFSTGHGASVDQEAVGEPIQTIRVAAEDIAKALNLVSLFVNGIKVNPRVWQAPIKSIRQVSR
jgi:hypothetical protein